jgi:hypothetical protein
MHLALAAGVAAVTEGQQQQVAGARHHQQQQPLAVTVVVTALWCRRQEGSGVMCRRLRLVLQRRLVRRLQVRQSAVCHKHPL